MKAPYNSIDVANYIVWRANAMGKPVTHLKLQKLLYYVVAKYAKDHNAMLINEDIVKWQYGPVTKSVYHHFKLRGSNIIDQPVPYLLSTDIFNLQFANTDEINERLSNNYALKSIVTDVLSQLINFAPFALVERTHQELAWGNYATTILSATQELPYSFDELKAANI